jgi:hypothetical protein
MKANWAVMFDVIDKETGERAKGWFDKYEIEIFAMDCSNPPPPLTAENLIEKLIEYADNPPEPAPTLTRREIEEVLNESRP